MPLNPTYMNDSTPQQNMQHPPMTPDRAKAALGNANLLQSFLLPPHTAQSKANMMAKNAPQTQENAPQPAETPEPKKDANIELDLTQKLDEMRKEMKSDMQREMDGIKTMIQQVLTEEDAKEETATTA